MVVTAMQEKRQLTEQGNLCFSSFSSQRRFNPLCTGLEAKESNPAKPILLFQYND